MKHNLKITILILSMFLITQFIGLYVVNYYSDTKVVNGELQNVSAPDLPFGMEQPKIQDDAEYPEIFLWIVLAFILAIIVMFLLTKFQWSIVLKLWFFVVVIIALSISFSIITNKLGIEKTIMSIPLVAASIALIFAIFKIYKRNFLIHNFTELFVYPGIAAVFVPILNIYTAIILLVLISVYDAWAVWHSGIMQKMAKYQMNNLNIFAGFFVPHADKKTRKRIKLMRQKLKQKKITKKELSKKRFRINMAILGGGDVIFPIIVAGVVLTTGFINLPFGLKHFVGGLTPALFVIIGATLGLAYLLFSSEKKKFYPAMPFITAGIFLGMLLSWVIF